MTINSILIHTATMLIFHFQPLLHNALCGHAKVLLLYMPFEFVPQTACKNVYTHHMLTIHKETKTKREYFAVMNKNDARRQTCLAVSTSILH